MRTSRAHWGPPSWPVIKAVGISTLHLIGMMATTVMVLASAVVHRPALATLRRARSSPIAANEALTTFHELRQLDGRVRTLESIGIDALNGFYEADKNCFSLTPGRPRISVTSTCFSLFAIDAAPAMWRQSPLRIRECVEALATSDVRETDTFHAVLVVAAARQMAPSMAMDTPPLASCVKDMLSARNRRRKGRDQILSAYLRYWLAHATSLLPEVSSDAEDEIYLSTKLALQRACDTAYDDLCRQLAFQAAGDGYSFDVVVLAYSLLTYVLVLDRLSGVAAREREMGARDAVGTGSSLPPRNDKLIRAGLALVFSEQVRKWEGSGQRGSQLSSREASAA